MTEIIKAVEALLVKVRAEGWAWGYFNGFKDAAAELPYAEFAARQAEDAEFFFIPIEK